MKLPESFITEVKELLFEELPDYLACLEEKHRCGLRVNTLKLTSEKFLSLSPFSLKQIPFIPNGFYYEEKEQPARHPFYHAGLYYIQEPSAMIPAYLLPITKGDHVLDLCAAPGGKSTELAAKLQGEGVLVSNDISNSRAKALLKNIELAGVKNALVLSETPDALSRVFPGYFDKILVDAPCSGEGMFRKSPSIIKNWEKYGSAYYHKLQKEILPFAVKMLRPGGYLLYSTCTFSPLENEGSLQYILETCKDMHVVPFAKEKLPKGALAARPELVGGFKEIENAIRLWPHRIEGEGHFVALLKKEEGNRADLQGFEETGEKKTALSKEALAFFEMLSFPIPKERILLKEDRVFLLPAGIKNPEKLRTLRSGLFLGEMKKNRFEPSQALASSLHPLEYPNCYDMAKEDENVIRYLKCESITLPESVKDGFVLICCEGYPLGFGKAQNNTLKNKYLPGWRWM